VGTAAGSGIEFVCRSTVSFRQPFSSLSINIQKELELGKKKEGKAMQTVQERTDAAKHPGRDAIFAAEVGS
jgi:hypothetical protein